MAVNVGLDIGSGSVRAAVVQTGKGAPSLRKYAEMTLPVGVIAAGEIIDESAVADAITTLWKTHKLPKKRVVIGLANQRVVVRRVDLPFMPEEELADALEFQAQEYIPMPAGDAVLDHVPLEQFATPEGEPMLSVLIVAAQTDVAATAHRVATQAGIKVMAVDLQIFAMVRAILLADPSLEATSAAIVSVGAGVTQVAVIQTGTVRFLRTIPLGGSDFTEAVIAATGVDRVEAEELKRRLGVAAEGMPSGDSRDEQARAALTKLGDQFTEEVRGSIDYYASQEGGDRPDRLLVTGNAIRLPHLANRLGRAVDLAVQPVSLTGGVLDTSKAKLSDAELQAIQPVLPVPVGLALWGTD